VVFVEAGQDVRVEGSIEAAIQAGVRQATVEGRLRNSVLIHPLKRRNSNDNTPAMIHYDIVPGSDFKLRILSKGGGCENASALAMLAPSAGEEGVIDFVLKTVNENGAASCPPLIVGVGIGGNFETAPLLAKKALLREMGRPSEDPDTARLEAELLRRINNLGLGPQGWGGIITALEVVIETAPCHIASLPLAVNLECHSHRMAEVHL
jgi:fumarate hydratase subunit alpha